MSSSIVDRLRNGTVLGAEGYVFELERRGYKAGPFVPEVVLDFPDAVRELHREFLRAPSMDLHPMFRSDISAKDAAFLHTWTA